MSEPWGGDGDLEDKDDPENKEMLALETERRPILMTRIKRVPEICACLPVCLSVCMSAVSPQG
jgi:hypothetical protein